MLHLQRAESGYLETDVPRLKSYVSKAEALRDLDLSEDVLDPISP